MNTDNHKIRARLICLCDDAQARQELTDEFQKAGYALIAAKGAANADLAIIDLRRAPVSGKKAQSIANLLRRSSPECRLIFITDPAVSTASREALRRHGEVVCARGQLDHVIERCRRILRIRNIAEEAGERLKSLAALNRLAAFPTIAASSAPPRVLVAGKPGPAALSAVNGLQREAAQCVSVFSAGQAMRALDHSDFDCLVFLPQMGSDPLISLLRALRRHPKHGPIPIITVSADAAHAASLARRGAGETLLTDHISADLSVKVSLAARRARLLRSMRMFLSTCAGDNVSDPVSSAFTGAFALEHGARLCARADQTGRPLTALAVKLTPENSQTKAKHLALRRAARLMNRLTRAEDIVARVAPTTFLILMPSTYGFDAEKVALRLEGVLENTVFRGERDDELYNMLTFSGLAERPQEYCIEETVALALKKLHAIEADAITPPRQQSPQ